MNLSTRLQLVWAAVSGDVTKVEAAFEAEAKTIEADISALYTKLSQVKPKPAVISAVIPTVAPMVTSPISVVPVSPVVPVSVV
jgi:hypothetical protein